MSNEAKPVGSITWTDLTVPNADGIRDFYSSVVGWEPTPLDMGGYDDFVLKMPEDGTPVAGICYARGGNAVLPPYWLVYITVKDLEQSAAQCRTWGKDRDGDAGDDWIRALLCDSRPGGRLRRIVSVYIGWPSDKLQFVVFITQERGRQLGSESFSLTTFSHDSHEPARKKELQLNRKERRKNS